jgi:hypothetical protein
MPTLPNALVYATLGLALTQFAVCAYADILLNETLRKLPAGQLGEFTRFRAGHLRNRLLSRKAGWVQQAAGLFPHLQPAVLRACRLIGFARWLTVVTLGFYCAAYFAQGAGLAA